MEPLTVMLFWKSILFESWTTSHHNICHELHLDFTEKTISKALWLVIASKRVWFSNFSRVLSAD